MDNPENIMPPATAFAGVEALNYKDVDFFVVVVVYEEHEATVDFLKG